MLKRPIVWLVAVFGLVVAVAAFGTFASAQEPDDQQPSPTASPGMSAGEADEANEVDDADDASEVDDADEANEANDVDDADDAGVAR